MTNKVSLLAQDPRAVLPVLCCKNKGYQVTILERQRFPRFSIGESLLPQCMEFISKQA